MYLKPPALRYITTGSFSKSVSSRCPLPCTLTPAACAILNRRARYLKCIKWPLTSLYYSFHFLPHLYTAMESWPVLPWAAAPLQLNPLQVPPHLSPLHGSDRCLKMHALHDRGVVAGSCGRLPLRHGWLGVARSALYPPVFAKVHSSPHALIRCISVRLKCIINHLLHCWAANWLVLLVDSRCWKQAFLEACACCVQSMNSNAQSGCAQYDMKHK